MRRLILLSLPLLGGGGALLGAASSPAAESRVLEEGYDALVAAFDEAHDTYRETLRSTKDLKEKRALRENHPVRTYWPRFRAVADAGDGRALVWMIENVRERGLRISETESAKTELYGELLEGHAGAAWFGMALEAMERDRRTLEDEAYAAGLRKVLGASEHKPVLAHATYLLWNHTRDVGASEEAAEALYQELVGTYGDTEWGVKARAQRVRPEDVEVGKLAPDFIGKSIDGHEFKLSDYRGKVVLLDFYGFW